MVEVSRPGMTRLGRPGVPFFVGSLAKRQHQLVRGHTRHRHSFGAVRSFALF